MQGGRQSARDTMSGQYVDTKGDADLKQPQMQNFIAKPNSVDHIAPA